MAKNIVSIGTGFLFLVNILFLFYQWTSVPSLTKPSDRLRGPLGSTYEALSSQKMPQTHSLLPTCSIYNQECFDFTHCLSSTVTAFFYPLEVLPIQSLFQVRSIRDVVKGIELYRQVVRASFSTLQLTENPLRACLFLPPLIPLLQESLQAVSTESLQNPPAERLHSFLLTLPHWKEGRNHLLYLFSPSSAAMKAMMVIASSAPFPYLRTHFDHLVLPPLNKSTRLALGSIHSNLFPPSVNPSSILVFPSNLFPPAPLSPLSYLISSTEGLIMKTTITILFFLMRTHNRPAMLNFSNPTHYLNEKVKTLLNQYNDKVTYNVSAPISLHRFRDFLRSSCIVAAETDEVCDVRSLITKTHLLSQQSLKQDLTYAELVSSFPRAMTPLYYSADTTLTLTVNPLLPVVLAPVDKAEKQAIDEKKTTEEKKADDTLPSKRGTLTAEARDDAEQLKKADFVEEQVEEISANDAVPMESARLALEKKNDPVESSGKNQQDPMKNTENSGAVTRKSGEEETNRRRLGTEDLQSWTEQVLSPLCDGCVENFSSQFTVCYSDEVLMNNCIVNSIAFGSIPVIVIVDGPAHQETLEKNEREKSKDRLDLDEHVESKNNSGTIPDGSRNENAEADTIEEAKKEKTSNRKDTKGVSEGKGDFNWREYRERYGSFLLIWNESTLPEFIQYILSMPNHVKLEMQNSMLQHLERLISLNPLDKGLKEVVDSIFSYGRVQKGGIDFSQDNAKNIKVINRNILWDRFYAQEP